MWKKTSITIKLRGIDRLWEEAIRQHGVNADHELAVYIVDQMINHLHAEMKDRHGSLFSALTPALEKRETLMEDPYFTRAFRRLKNLFTCRLFGKEYNPFQSTLLLPAPDYKQLPAPEDQKQIEASSKN